MSKKKKRAKHARTHEPLEVSERDAEVVAELPVVVVDFYGLVVDVHGLLYAAEGLERAAEVVHGVAVARRELQRPAEGDLRLGGPVHGHEHLAEVLQARHAVRVDGQPVLVEPLGLLGVPGPARRPARTVQPPHVLHLVLDQDERWKGGKRKRERKEETERERKRERERERERKSERLEARKKNKQTKTKYEENLPRMQGMQGPS